MIQGSTEKISILIVDDIPETRENLRKLLYFEADIEIAGMASNGHEAIEQARRLQPHIVLMDINMPDMDGIAASQEITRVAPACQVIMMSVQSEADYLRRSMLAGAMDFLTKPFTSEELSGSIHRVYEMGASRRATLPMMPVAEEGLVPRPPGSAEPARRPVPGGKLLLIYSPKGGTGCSTVATNLAMALHQVTSKKVALVDTSLQFGDVDAMLNLQGNVTIAEATARADELDGDLLNAMMAPHPSGIRVLAAPSAPELSETISVDDVKNILLLLRREFDFVVVDTWSYLDDMVLAAMDLADRVLIVMTPEIPSVKSTTQFLGVAEALQYPLNQVDLILNKIIPRDILRAEQLESSMKHRILIQLEFEPRGIRQAVNQGLPLIMASPNHPLSQSFLELARQEVASLSPRPVEVPADETASLRQEPRRRTGLFGRLRK
jgi:pilus assembly protein CpaE